MTIDLVPLYGSTGKSITQERTVSSTQHKRKARLTHINRDTIPPPRQVLPIIPPPQLRKRRQPRRPHPILEMLVRSQVGKVFLGVPIWVPFLPIGRWDDLVETVVRASSVDVFARFAGPGDAFLGECVGGRVVRRC